MKARPPLPEGPYLVVGLARSGQAAARLLAGRGERVTGIDSGSPEGAAALRDEGIEAHLGADGVDLLHGVRTLVKSPGVPREARVVAAAREGGVEVVGELELAWRLVSNRFVAVTGTNGKTTVTELLGHIWRVAGEPVAVAGNVGTPLASLVGETSPKATIVCECSSFQLEDASAFAPECAVLLNLSPDHLDRHADFGDYVEAKLRIFANQGPGDVAVCDESNPALAGRRIGGEARRVPISVGEPFVERGELRLVGPHNRHNAAAAAAAAAAMGVPEEAIVEGIGTFEGIPHRLEVAAEANGVTYVNDSKATNVAAATAALRSFDGGVRAILGGSLKGEDFGGMLDPVSERCAACYLIGPAAGPLERELAPARESGVELRRCRDMEDAVRSAAADAKRGETVLLAPACASFDAYANFEERGDHFRALARELAKG